MKLYTLAPIVAVLVASSTVHAAAATENECGAAARAAEQLRSAGNLSAARARLSACLSPGCSGQVREACARQQEAIDAAMPAVVLEAKDEASNNITAVRVTMDGAPLLDRLDGTPILVNPGEHRVTFDAAGFRGTESTFAAREGQKKLRVVVFLDSARSPGPAVARVVSPAPAAPGLPEERRPEEPKRILNRQNVALALGGAGVAGVAVGTIWAIMSKVKYDHALALECGGDPNHCSAQGIVDGRTAHRQATIATVGFVAAGALFAAGAALYFTAPQPTDVAVVPTVDRGGGLAVVGSW